MTNRIVCHFSCGAASAVATKLMLAEYPADQVVLLNAFIKEEHEDNRRFLSDCEEWFGHPITVLRDTKYGASTHEVWRKERFMKNHLGASCSRALKRNFLDSFRLPGDVTVLGFTVEEKHRLDRFFDRGSDLLPVAPLIERGLTKMDCLAIVERAGIELPAMYKLGYHNANCIGCIKGGQGYWNKIRRDFPVQFEQIAAIQEELGLGANLFRRKDGTRFSLRELPVDAGHYPSEPSVECSFFCEIAEQDILEGE